MSLYKQTFKEVIKDKLVIRAAARKSMTYLVVLCTPGKCVTIIFLCYNRYYRPWELGYGCNKILHSL